MSTMETKPKGIPRIQHTPELEDAAVALTNAKDSKGNPVVLVANPLDIDQVRLSLRHVAEWFDDPSFFFDQEPSPAAAAIAAAENLALLAKLMAAHLKAGNT